MSKYAQGIGYIDNLQAFDDPAISEKVVLAGIVNFAQGNDKEIYNFLFDMQTVSIIMDKGNICPNLMDIVRN